MPTIDPRHAMQHTRHCWFGTNNPALGPMLPWGPKGPPFTCLGYFDEARGPVATIRIPCRLQEGFHGIWIPQAELPG